MRIYDKRNKRKLNTLLILLTPAEVLELKGSLMDLSEDLKLHHFHIDDERYKREITIGVYTPENLHTISPAVVKLIEDDD